MVDEATILKLQAVVEAEHDAERERLNAEQKADNAAIRRVLQLLRRHKLNPAPFPANHVEQDYVPDIVVNCADNTSSGTQPQFNGLQADPEALILATIDGFDRTFTFSELLDALRERVGQHFDRKTVSWVIYRNKNKRVKVVQEGRGRRKAIYAKA